MTRRGVPTVIGLVLFVIAIAVVFVFLFPLLWTAITSVKPPTETFQSTFIPYVQFQPTLEHWANELGRAREIVKGFKNSILISLGATVLAGALGSLAAYGLARFRFRRWRNSDMALWFLSQRFLPPIVMVIPIFVMMQRLNLVDSPLALIIANTTFTMPFVVLIMRDAFQDIPVEIEESALVDGCSRFRAFWSIALPLAAPALAAACIIVFAFTWNEFLFALVLTNRDATPMTITIAGSFEQRGVQFWKLAVRILLVMALPAILVAMVQRYIVRGLTFGAVK